jgi:hypothetical protein
VHDPAVVRRLEPARDLDRVRDGLGDIEALQAPDALLQRLAVDELEASITPTT